MRREDVRQYAFQFGVGIAAVAVALLISLLMRDFIASTPLLLFFAAVLVATWYGGLVVGVFAAILALLSANTFFFVPRSLAGTPNDLARFFILILFACLVYILRRSRQRTLKELEQSRDQLSIILREVADGITVQDAAGKLTYANYEGAHVLGFATSEALLAAPLSEVMKDFEIFDEEGQPFPLQSLPGRLALLGMRFPEATVRFRSKSSGRERWAVVKARPVFNARGEVTLAINLFQDITNAKTAEQEIFKQREQLRVTLASIGDGVIATDVKGKITFLNPVAAR